MKRFRHILISTFSGLLCLALLGTAGLAQSKRKGSDTKGRHYFRQECKDCHVKGGKGGEISPLTKTQAQWRTYFTKGKHSGGAEALTKFMTDDQLIDLQAFLINHAADSLQPETCGK